MWEPQTSAYLVAIACSQAYLSRSAEERAGRAEAAPAERLDELLAGRYPEPAYVVEFAYPGLQTPQDASSSSILPSQDRYRGVWCVNPYPVLFRCILAFSASYPEMAYRGGPGPSPIGHHELELMIAICLQMTNEADNPSNPLGLSGQLPNPLWHPAIKVLRAPFLEYLGKHPERAAALLRQPRRISIPRHAWKQQQTILNTFPLVNGRQFLYGRSLHATFDKLDVQHYPCVYPGNLIPALLDRGEGQTVSVWEISRLQCFLTLECRYLKGCDIPWALVDSPADAGGDSDNEGSLSDQDVGPVGRGDTRHSTGPGKQGLTAAAPVLW